MSPRPTARVLTTGLAVACCLATLTAAPAVAGQVGAAAQLCGKWDSTPVEGGRYIVQNNVWGASTPQCIDVNGTGFTVTTAGHNNATNGSPASYPSIYAGCHYRNCTTGSGLPRAVSQLSGARSSWSTSVPSQGVYDTAYDLWYDPNPNQTGQNAGELMIWLNHRGSVQPVGSKVATAQVAGATWDVWTGNIGWNVISYVRTSPTTSVSNLDLNAFTQDAVSRGSINRSWYLTSVQAGFEPWQGGTGLATHSFSFSLG
ncbi:GH12 family glycosyl hydrolase domain-containing protein [Goodfellowiella coeruleoviolacea]|uniref:Glycosyl hydrolase family 12 n=1 Tax=Goodfellowiella coeruleoviolacea TaxID=334858 RepID=A0AAE3GDJ3_9PSEU|nr:glycoside hydrolase [Goodfellowiella coeruleoviolacea]MCP2164158.1 Glycosyl hydrolase family 12 [Goodfellowiella coeruleoviolacea]